MIIDPKWNFPCEPPGINCPVCGKPAKFVEDNEDMGWYCEKCHVAIETGVDDIGD